MTTKPTTPETTPLTVGSVVRVEKGCRALGIDKGTSATITEIRELGADYSHSVRVVLTFRNGFQSGKSPRPPARPGCDWSSKPRGIGRSTITLARRKRA